MIKIAIKHFIYEKCISILFDFINRNFPIHKVKKFTADMFREGAQYNYIKISYPDVYLLRILYECRIHTVYPNSILITYDRYVDYVNTENKSSKKFDMGSTCFVGYNQIIEIS